jgi:hypothetical protein
LRFVAEAFITRQKISKRRLRLALPLLIFEDSCEKQGKQLTANFALFRN